MTHPLAAEMVAARDRVHRARALVAAGVYTPSMPDMIEFADAFMSLVCVDLDDHDAVRAAMARIDVLLARVAPGGEWVS